MMPKRLLTTIGFVLLMVVAAKAQDAGSSQYEYWIDNDFEGRTVSRSESLSIDIAGMVSGAHFLNVMRYNAEDGTSNCYRYAFLKKSNELNSGGEIQSLEYWIDNDMEGRQASASDAIAIDISALDAGAHFLNVMCYATDGTSNCYRYAFLKRELDTGVAGGGEYSYWIDDDFAGRTKANGESVMVDISGLAKGLHFFNVMCYDSEGISSCYRKSLYIHEPDDVLLSEGWIDGAYIETRTVAEAKDGTAMFSIDISELDNGKHWFNFASRNTSGSWNVEDSLQFVKRELEPLADGEWDAVLALRNALIERGWQTPWDISEGELAVYLFDGLQVDNGYIVGLDISGNGFEGAVPSEIQAFRHLEWLDISRNKFTGNVGLLACELPETLTSLDVADNCFDDLYPMVSPDVKLTIGAQTTGKNVNMNVSKLNLDEVFEQVPRVLLYDHKNQTYRTALDILVTNSELTEMSISGVADWAIRMEASAEGINLRYVDAPMVYHGKSGDRLLVYTFGEGDKLQGSSFGLTMSFDKGDANFANGVDAADLQATILYVFDSYRYMPFNFTAADTYEDDNINVQDVVCTVNLLLANDAPQQMRLRAPAVGHDEGGNAACVFVKDGKIVLHSDIPVAALSIKMSGQADWDISRYGMTQSVDGGNMVGYSLSGATLPAGDVVIGTCAEGTMVRSVSAADAEAEPVEVGIGDSMATGVSPATAGQRLDGDIYDVAGKRRNNTSNGVNIVKKTGRAVKVITKANK